MVATDKTPDVKTVRKRTRQAIRGACNANQPVLIEAPPISGKTTSAFEIALWADKPVTYLTAREDLYEQAENWCEKKQNLICRVIPSPQRNCPTFQSDDSNGERARKLYKKGYSAYKIHKTRRVNTPCSQSGCEYLENNDYIKNHINEIDLLIGHYKHAHNTRYTNDRITVLDEFPLGQFINDFPSNEDILDDPGEIIPDFLSTVDEHEGNFPTGTYADVTDLIMNRTDCSERTDAFEWFLEYGVSPRSAEGFDFLEVSEYSYDKTHLIAPFLTFSVLCMERVAPRFELAPATGNASQDVHRIWEEADIETNYRCIRNRNTGAMSVLRPPDLSNAAQVIALDAIPTVEMWNLLLPQNSEFDHQTIIKRENLQTYLSTALNLSVIQIGGGNHYYSGGRVGEIDSERFAVINARENMRYPLITPKQALEKYRARHLIKRYVKESSFSKSYLVKNYGEILSSNEFKSEPFGTVFGSPHPGNNTVEKYASFSGYSAVPENSEDEREWTNLGEKILSHFTDHRVIQAILRFGREESIWKNDGATVYVSTKALPEWFAVDTEVSIKKGTKKNDIIEFLILAEQSDDLLTDQSPKSIQEKIECEVSENHIRDTLEQLRNSSLVKVREEAGAGGASLYQWCGEEYLLPLRKGEYALALNNEYYIISEKDNKGVWRDTASY